MCVGGDPSPVEHHPPHAQREGRVAAGARLHVEVREGGARVAGGVYQGDPSAAALELLEHGDEVRPRDVGVLAPQHRGLRVHQVVQVVGVLVAEICHLRGVARAPADVAPLVGDGAQEGEEAVGDVLHEAQGPAAAVVKDGLGAALVAHPAEGLGAEVQGLVPGRGLEHTPATDERRGEPLGAVLPREELVRAVAEKAAGDGVRGVSLEPHDAAVFDVREDGAGVGAVAVARGANGGHRAGW